MSHSQLQREGSTKNLKLLNLKINTNGCFVGGIKLIIAVPIYVSDNGVVQSI